MIIRVITDEYHFWNWIKNSDSYGNNFSLEGSKAVFNYFDDLSDDIGENIEFDPIAWCCEFTEYDNLEEATKYYDEIKSLDDLRDKTTVLELDNGHLIVGEY